MTWTNQPKKNTSWDFLGGLDLLLQENGFFILLEQEGNIALEQSEQVTTSWTNQPK